MRCSVKSGNERNPYLHLPARNGGNSEETASVNGEEGGDDVRSAWPLYLGQHPCYNGYYKGSQYREMELILKSSLSSDWSLQLDSMKSESLVIANQHVAVNTFSGFVHTARQTTKVGNAQRRWPNSQEREPSKAGSMIGVKS